MSYDELFTHAVVHELKENILNPGWSCSENSPTL